MVPCSLHQKDGDGSCDEERACDEQCRFQGAAHGSPALVIGVPVGFVNVVESKERLFATCEAFGVPAIVAMGRKGGSNVAAAICNALLYSAAEMLDPAARGWR